MKGLEIPSFCACTQAQVLMLPQAEQEVRMELCEPGGRQSPQLEVSKHWVVLGQAHGNVLKYKLDNNLSLTEFRWK